MVRRALYVALAVSLAWQVTGHAKNESNLVLLPVSNDPTVSIRVLFNAGSQNDPAGKEGLAALTADLITEGATAKHSYEQLLELLYPMAASVETRVDKEMTVFIGRTHRDNLEAYYNLFKEVLLEPKFDESDFTRVKNDRLNYIKTSLRYAQDEELGKEVLYELIFAGTPYGHNEDGHVASLEAITLEDVRQFYRSQYNRASVRIGLGGGFDSDFAKRVEKDFAALPDVKPANVPAPKPTAIRGMEVVIVKKNAGSTAISFGFPVDVLRGSKDFYALAIAKAWLGEHRNNFSHLYDVIREKRGLNYGDYAYIEHFPMSHNGRFPPPNVARRKQIFQIWIRPVPHENNVFAFRAAMRELKDLVDNGMSVEEFELTRKFLKGYNLHYAPTTMMQLGYAIDDRFYGIEKGHWNTFKQMLDSITREDVNQALKKYLNYENVKVVFITRDAEALKETLVANAPSPITYASEKPAAILEEDGAISTYPLSVKPESVKIVDVEELFKG
jgi:zinc protease